MKTLILTVLAILTLLFVQALLTQPPQQPTYEEFGDYYDKP